MEKHLNDKPCHKSPICIDDRNQRQTTFRNREGESKEFIRVTRLNKLTTAGKKFEERRQSGNLSRVSILDHSVDLYDSARNSCRTLKLSLKISRWDYFQLSKRRRTTIRTGTQAGSILLQNNRMHKDRDQNELIQLLVQTQWFNPKNQIEH